MSTALTIVGVPLFSTRGIDVTFILLVPVNHMKNPATIISIIFLAFVIFVSLEIHLTGSWLVESKGVSLVLSSVS